jgi:hypothetical protein
MRRRNAFAQGFKKDTVCLHTIEMVKFEEIKTDIMLCSTKPYFANSPAAKSDLLSLSIREFATEFFFKQFFHGFRADPAEF